MDDRLAKVLKAIMPATVAGLINQLSEQQIAVTLEEFCKNNRGYIERRRGERLKAEEKRQEEIRESNKHN